MLKEIYFFDQPVAFQRIAFHAVACKTFEDLDNEAKVLVKWSAGPNSNIIYVARAVEPVKYLWHDMLSNVPS